jgi:hypothetical protein
VAEERQIHPAGSAFSVPNAPEIDARSLTGFCPDAASALGAMMGYRKSKTDDTRLGILGKAIELVGRSRVEETLGIGHLVLRFVRAWETGDFGELVSMLTEDAVLTMPPWVYWLDGRDAIAATMQSPGTWEGEPRPGRYRIVPCGMNGQPAALAYVRFGDGPYVAVCMTVMTLAPDGRISGMDTFILPKQFTAWGLPATLAPATELAVDDHDGDATARVL